MGMNPVGFYWVLDLVELRDFEIFVRLGRAAAVSALVLGTTSCDDAVSETEGVFILHVENTLLQDNESGSSR